MWPIKTKDTTDTLVGPEGSGIEPLPVMVENDATTSIWELDDDERARLAAGGRIGLVVLAHPQPPVALAIASPYCNKCGELMRWDERLGIYLCAETEES